MGENYQWDKIDWITYLIWTIFGIFIIFLIFNSFSKKIENKIEYRNYSDNCVVQPNISYYPDYKVYASLAYEYPKTMRDTIMCESNWQHYNKNGTILRGKAGEYGICQFMLKTWNIYSKKSGLNGSIYSAEDQLELMKWMWDNNLMNHWTCYSKTKSLSL